MLLQMVRFPFFNGWIIFCFIYMYVNSSHFLYLFIHQWTLRCFHVFCSIAIVNNVQWTQRCRYLLKLVFSFPLHRYPEMELLDHMVVLFLIFWGTSVLISIVAAQVYIPTKSAQEFGVWFLTTLLFQTLPIIISIN